LAFLGGGAGFSAALAAFTKSFSSASVKWMDSTVRLASLSTFMICWRTFSASAPDFAWANCWRSFRASSLAWATCWARFSASLGPQPVDRNTTNRLTSSKTIRFINVLLFAPFPRLPTIACLQRKVFGLLRVGRGEYSPRRPDDCLRRGESVAGFSRSPPFFHTHVPRDSYGTLPTRNGCEPRSETGTRRASRGAARFSTTSPEPHFVKTRSPVAMGRKVPRAISAIKI